MPSAGLWPLTFVVVPLFGAALVLTGARGGRAFALGTLTGTVAFLGIIGWASNIQPGGALAWPLLSLVEGLYLGAFAAVVAPFLERRWLAVPSLGLGWVGFEVFRGSFPEGGFGWAQLSYAHVDGSWLRPLARLGGSHLLLLVVALLGALGFEAWRQGRDAVGDLPGSPWERFQAAAPHAQRPLFWLAGVLFVSVLATVEPPPPTSALDVLVVQGNDLRRGTHDLPARDLDLAIAQRHLELTRTSIEAHGVPDLVVWPESAIDRDPDAPGNEDLREVLAEGAALAEGALVVGITRRGPQDEPGGAPTFRNTVSLVGTGGDLVATYDKRQLVPFGEYVPARGLLGRIGPLSAVASDGIPGRHPTHLTVRGDDGAVRLAVAICFETLFGNTVRDNVLGDEGLAAGVLVATTNDASFDVGSEPAQHLAQSQMRAIETGRWVVHAAISGSSALVDPEGTVHHATSLFEATSIRASVPVVTGMTPYLTAGDVAGKLGLVALAALALAAPIRAGFDRRRAKEPA